MAVARPDLVGLCCRSIDCAVLAQLVQWWAVMLRSQVHVEPAIGSKNCDRSRFDENLALMGHFPEGRGAL